MANLKYDKEIAALLAIDPYNDFISEGGKLWDRLKSVADANGGYLIPKRITNLWQCIFEICNGAQEIETFQAQNCGTRTRMLGMQLWLEERHRS